MNGFRFHIAHLISVVIVLTTPLTGRSQTSLISKDIFISSDTTFIDSGVIVPGSFVLADVSPLRYHISLSRGLLIRTDSSLNGPYSCSYRILNPELSRNYYNKDTSIINRGVVATTDPFRIRANSQNNTDLFGSGLNKTGSISRGVSFGNNQNLSVNSNLNLQMSGKIAPDISIIASVTDDNIPIQPEGNTQQLQDFDQVYIKVFNEKNWELAAGDFWLQKPEGYFMTYKKRAQGGSFTGVVISGDKQPIWKIQASGAISKGKFSRNVIQGTEGNQGPYKLTGEENEPFIIILAGTERVYIDGKLLTRGQENDYVMNYNTAEVIFTAKNLITKDRRIIVEFQYSDQNYARSLFQVSNEVTLGNTRIWLNAYSEQDSRNQPLQANLGDSTQFILANAGDQTGQAFVSSVDTSEYSDNRLMYYKKDTTVGSDTYNILVYTVEKDCTHYKATFSNVGSGNGNYVLQEITALGRVYRWVAPAGGVPQGTHEPVILLTPPNKQQMVTGGLEYSFNKRTRIGGEVAYSNYDKNTFSELDSGDDQGIAARGYWQSKKPVGNSKKNFITSDVDLEFVNHNFKRIERFRAVEFERNWNTADLVLNGDQILGSAALGYQNQKLGVVQYRYNMFRAESSIQNYQGIKNDVDILLGEKDWKANVRGSYLRSQGAASTTFLRHKGHLHKDIGLLRISFDDEHELNQKSNNATGYEFYDWQGTLGTTDSLKSSVEVFYRQRNEQRPDSNGVLGRAAIANHYGGTVGVNGDANKLRITAAYRELKIVDTTRLTIQPENTLVGRLEHRLSALKGGLTTSTYYEIGSGLELKREFLYIEVQPGQGTYTWIDYDNDDVKDLNEFEVAAFSDQANYIRVFTPTNEYVKTFTNQFNESIFIKPSQIWRRDSGFKKFVARFSDQFIYRVDRKTNSLEPSQLYNPFLAAISDTSLISISSSFRNTFYFNRTHQKFGMDYTYQKTTGKTLLTSGFDSRLQEFHEIRMRWNLSRTFTLQTESTSGIKRTQSDYVSGRNYSLRYMSGKISLSYQPGVQTRLSFSGLYTEKNNAESFGGEQAKIINGGLELRHNVISKGSITTQVNYIYNSYTAEANTTLAYEMLEALKPGKNFTWTVFYQRAISKNLQVNINYTGRKSPENRSIHTGGVQVRALF